MDSVLHVSYHQEFRKWRVTTDVEEKFDMRKSQIQEKLKGPLVVIIDQPTPGSGNTNDRNTARRFFDNIHIVAEASGFDKNHLCRFKTILRVISTHYSTNVEAFEVYCLDTTRQYVETYPWYYMPPSTHTILMHRSRFIEYAPLPIGLLSEEAQEANHKNVKKFCDRYARKFSRVETNTDIFERLFLCSDPIISLSRKNRKKHNFLTQEMK